MITDSNFTIYIVTVNGEKHSIQPSREHVELAIGYGAYNHPKEHYEETGDVYDYFPVVITCTRDLEDAMEDDVDDATFELFEALSLKGK